MHYVVIIITIVFEWLGGKPTAYFVSVAAVEHPSFVSGRGARLHLKLFEWDWRFSLCSYRSKGLLSWLWYSGNQTTNGQNATCTQELDSKLWIELQALQNKALTCNWSERATRPLESTAAKQAITTYFQKGTADKQIPNYSLASRGRRTSSLVCNR